MAMWDDRYSADEFVYGTAPNDFLRDCELGGTIPPSSNVLCIAEGEGRNAVFLAGRGHTVLAMDSSAVGIEKVKSLASERGVAVQTEVANLADFCFGSDRYDSIVGIFCHVPPPIRARMLRDIPMSLKKGGVLVMECYTPRQLEYKTGGPPAPEMMFTKELIEEAFEGRLKLERCEEVVRNVIEGKLHTGKGAVVQVIARKE